MVCVPLVRVLAGRAPDDPGAIHMGAIAFIVLMLAMSRGIGPLPGKF